MVILYLFLTNWRVCILPFTFTKNHTYLYCSPFMYSVKRGRNVQNLTWVYIIRLTLSVISTLQSVRCVKVQVKYRFTLSRTLFNCWTSFSVSLVWSLVHQTDVRTWQKWVSRLVFCFDTQWTRRLEHSGTPTTLLRIVLIKTIFNDVHRLSSFGPPTLYDCCTPSINLYISPQRGDTVET